MRWVNVDLHVAPRFFFANQELDGVDDPHLIDDHRPQFADQSAAFVHRVGQAATPRCRTV